jgi:S-adenosylmethionine decarboxylase
MEQLGTHLHLELWECGADTLDTQDTLRDAMLSAAVKARCTVVSEAFHKFSPQGVTGVVVLAESHISIHTWPELGYAAVDIFTCGDHAMPERAAEFLVEELQAGRHTMATFARGIPMVGQEGQRKVG